MEKIAVYNQNCLRPGELVHGDRANDFLFGMADDDLMAVELSEGSAARYYGVACHSSGGEAAFFRRIAQTIRENL